MGNVSSSQERSRAEVAEYLRKFAEKLDPAGTRTEESTGEARQSDGAPTGRADGVEKVTVVAGNESATINPPETVTFDVEVATDSSILEGAGSERSATFSLRWNEEHVEEDDELSVR